MLFLVSIEPYLFSIVTNPGQLDPGAATAVYAIDLGSLFLILGYFNHEITLEPRKLVPKELLLSYRRGRNGMIVAAVLFYVSTVPIFWSIVLYGVQLRYIIWIVPLAFGLVRWTERARRPHREAT